jgi:hypothetical protein
LTDFEPTDHPMLILTEGGPLYRIEKRLGFIREQSPRIVRRAIFSIFLTWVPLFVLCSLQGTAFGARVAVPYLRDFAIYTRFLLALPILLAAETILGPHIAHAAAHFVHARLVLEDDYKRFDHAVEEGLRWRDSTVAELVLVVVAYFTAYASLRSMSIQASTWYATHTGATFTMTLAGWWYVFFCIPLFQFLILRWIWRLFLWGQFLWRMRRLNLQLVPTHPDESAGLAFVGEAHRFFSVILFASFTSFAGVLANELVYDKTPLPHFAPLIATYVTFAVLLVLLPLTVFAPVLLQIKRTGLYKYGSLATEYTSSFQKKWIETPPPRGEPLLGTADIQSLADLGNSYSFVEKMGPMPMDSRTPINLILACLLPMVPLLLTMMPLKDVIKMLFKLVV